MYVFALFVLLRAPRKPFGWLEVASGILLFLNTTQYLTTTCLYDRECNILIEGAIVFLFQVLTYLLYCLRARRKLAELDTETLNRLMLKT